MSLHYLVKPEMLLEDALTELLGKNFRIYPISTVASIFARFGSS